VQANVDIVSKAMMNNSNTLLICPVCNKRHTNKDIKTVAAKGQVVVVHITCTFCNSLSLAMFSAQNYQEGYLTMGMLTDLKFEEVLEMVKEGPITADEVLEINQKIRTI
jgi:hypothetical protein